MTESQTSLFPPRNLEELIEELKYLTEEIQELYCLDEIPWVIGYSGGKDSTAVLQLIWNAIAQLPLEKRQKTIYVITTDTLVENPLVAAWVRSSLEQMKKAAQEQQMPIEPHLLTPEPDQSYWVALIGKGYPAPRNKFRWCTGRLKIDPSNRFIREVIRTNNEAIVVLGTRKTESLNRSLIMNKRDEKKIRDRLCPHPHLPSSLLYTPIENLTTDEIWLYLMQWENPWGYSNQDLFKMYRGATADNECPLVIDTSTPSCGNSRFGCWVCTLVDSDKSLTAMIQNDEEKEWLEPLLEIRKEIDPKNDREKRDFRRIYGKVELFERKVYNEDGKEKKGETEIVNIPGPYTKEWREYWLKMVLSAQIKLRKNAPPEFQDITLISQAELSEIRKIWLEEKHEFEDSLPRIYEEVTGEKFEDQLGAGNTFLGIDEWSLLSEICENEMHLELMAKLLDTERQYYTKVKRIGIYDDLEKCFEISSRNQEEAINNAKQKRDLKEAVKAHDFAKIEQLSWAHFKFNQ